MSVIPVVLSYNHPELTAKAIGSVSAQRMRIKETMPLPLVLVHNGSDKRHVAALQLKFPEVDHLILNSNKGFSGGANEGIRYALENYDQQSSWVLFLTNDCELESWPELPSNYPPSFLAPWIWARKTNRIDSIGGKLNLITGVPSHLKSEEDFYKLIEKASKNEAPYIPGSAFLIHRAAFYQLKGFNEVFGTYWEDIDFSLRALKLGVPMRILSSFQVRHKIGKTCHKNSYYTTYLYQRNRHWVSRNYVKGSLSRLQLEAYLWSSWIKLSWRLFLARRYFDLLRLMRGIFEKNPLYGK